MHFLPLDRGFIIFVKNLDCRLFDELYLYINGEKAIRQDMRSI